MDTLFAELPGIEDPLERAARSHHGIASVHPFSDGNGRVARLATNFILLAAGYPPVSIANDLRHDYHFALEAADQGDFRGGGTSFPLRSKKKLDHYLEALSPAA